MNVSILYPRACKPRSRRVLATLANGERNVACNVDAGLYLLLEHSFCRLPSPRER